MKMIRLESRLLYVAAVILVLLVLCAFVCKITLDTAWDVKNQIKQANKAKHTVHFVKQYGSCTYHILLTS